MLTATYQKLQISKQVIVPSITLPKCQCDAFLIFAVFDPLLLTLWINGSFFIFIFAVLLPISVLL